MATRRKVHAEAAAVGGALVTLGGYDVHYLNPNLLTSRSLAVRSALESKTTFMSSAKRATSMWLPVKAAALWLGTLLDRVRMQSVFAKIRPSLVILFDDRNVRPDLTISAIARAKNVPIVIVPFAVSTFEADKLARNDKTEHRVAAGAGRWFKRAITKLWPGHELDNLLFFSSYETLALAAAGIVPPCPWVQGGSGVDLICASGPDEYAYLTSGGIESARIAMTGQPSLDALNMPSRERNRHKLLLREKYKLPAGKPLVICAVPQDAEHHLVDWGRHRQLIELLFVALRQSGAAILLSLHPRSQVQDYESTASRYGLPIVTEPLADILPAADLLIATFSSTVRWAIGLGIPVFVVDALGLRLNLYRNLDGVTVLDDHVSLERLLTRFVNDGALRSKMAMAAETGAARVGRVDGRASARLVEAISHLMPGCQ